mmetsp:Transcript_23910/g.56488  ORF Transcript_23910/g.56488 Transcript_23910/m.56488 type:complete len:670 (+) Transcript_23910:114-2123(+)
MTASSLFCQPCSTFTSVHDTDETDNHCSSTRASSTTTGRRHGQRQKRSRKGDPRMHKAVAARLKSPEISLFDALKIGGFEYISNNDSSATDSEKVTLGQRKNQLSRRLRLAKKNNADCDHDSHDGDSGDAAENAILQNDGSVGSGDGGTQVPSSKFGARALQMKRELDFAIADEETAASSGAGGTAASSQSKGRQQLMMEEDFSTSMQGTANASLSAVEAQLEQASKRPRVAKFHPDFAPLIVPPTSFRHSSMDSSQRNMSGMVSGLDGGAGAPTTASSLTPGPSTTSYPSLSSFPGSIPAPYGLSYGGLGAAGGAATSYGLPTTISTNMFAPSQPRASAVAVSSLTSSAQAVGLTLEQLALALSSNTSALAKLVSDTRTGESIVKQLDLAMNLYSGEVKALYSRCMLQAGIDPALAEPEAPTYLDFASKAWQKEGKRLAEMMGKARMENISADLSGLDHAATAGANAAASGTQNHPDVTARDGPSNVSLNTTNDGEAVTSTAAASAGEKDQHCHKGHDSSTCNANHVHQLGQCGHRAIIHHPPEGSPHIDFIVGDHVECYSGIDSVPLGRNLDSIWPSQFKCKDVDDNDGSSTKICAKTIGGSSVDGYLSAGDSSAPGIGSEPKILKLSDVNLEDPEWNYDSDGGVMGLFKLGENETMDNADPSTAQM